MTLTLLDPAFLGSINSLALWTPSQLGASLALWLDAADAASITLNGSTVSQWSDKSGNNRHATQATAASQPTYTSSGLIGKPALIFDGNSDFLSVPQFATTNTVGMIAGGGSGTAPQLSGAAPANFAPAWNVNKTRVAYRGVTDNSVRLTSLQSGTVADYGLGVVTLNNATSQVSMYHNGGTEFLFSQTLGSGDRQINTVGRDFMGGDQFANGQIAEIVAIGAVLSTADRQNLEGYLAHKWGLESSLPADHPYKSNPPRI